MFVLRYSEIKDYTFGKEPSWGGPVTGHFTQVIDFMMLSTFLRTAMFYHADFDFRWSGKEALMLELASLRREARSSFSYFSLFCTIFHSFG